MTRFQDSQWACSLTLGGGSVPSGVDDQPARGPGSAAGGGSNVALAVERRHSRGWFDSSWDLRVGADVAELSEFPPEFREVPGPVRPARNTP